jgi:hypothetical protein
VQDSLQGRITGALEQLSQVTNLLNDKPTHDLEQSTQLEDLLNDIIRQQNEIANGHETWAELQGDTAYTVQLGINETVTKEATSRCAQQTLSALQRGCD